MQAHHEDETVLGLGCLALSRLTMSVDISTHIADVRNVIQAIVAAMRAFPAAVELQLHGCNALGNTCQSMPDNQPQPRARWRLSFARCARMLC